MVGFNSLGQTTCEGIVKDKTSNNPIPYVNIGIINKNIGTVSNKEGKFKIQLENLYNDDSIRLSCVGYESLQFKVLDFKLTVMEDKEISLEEEISKLSEIVINGKREKEKIYGNTTHSKNLRAGFTDSELGNELGIIIKIGKRPIYINAFHAFIVSNTSDSMKFRLNFYSLKNGLPKDKLIKEQIVFSITTKAGQFTFDLTNYNIIMPDDFFISLELIENYSQESKKGILFSVGLLGSPLIARETSQGTWEKYNVFSLGFNVTAQD